MVNNSRLCGVLLHITSLPSAHGMGDFGPHAHAFAEFLAQAGQSVWQILPLTPINSGAGNSPYSSYSAFAGNIFCISPDYLVLDGFLRVEDVQNPPGFPEDRVDYAAATAWRRSLLELAFDNALPQLRTDAQFQTFCEQEQFWLHSYALFMALKQEHHGAPWYQWPESLRLADKKALESAENRLGYFIVQEKFYQYLFARHWTRLRQHCAHHGISILGDAPIYVSLDSADVWANRDLFALDPEGLPVFCAGAPPDYFSETGQMWGNPVYDWDRLEQKNFDWWITRLRHEHNRYDLVRLDHFRGFCAFWQVPACEPTAENGVWIPAPGKKLFSAVQHAIPDLSLVAEDLGFITEDVRELMDQFGFPGMKILHFAFSPDMERNAYIPHNIPHNSVVFTGTHDNNTTRGWFTTEVDGETRLRLNRYAGHVVTQDNAASTLIRLALGCPAQLAIIPMQDYLNLDEHGRMNIPGIAEGNWSWRMRTEHLTPVLGQAMRMWAKTYGREPRQ